MNHLKQLREKAGLSRGELALAIGLKTAGAIEHYEADRRAPPLDKAHRIVSTLNSKGVECVLDDVFPPPKSKRRRAA
jgi:putative transcriptional regulator